MNYIFYFKQQVKLYILYALSGAISYNITCYFGWGKPIILTSGNIAAFISGTLTFIFLGPLYYMWFNSLKK